MNIYANLRLSLLALIKWLWRRCTSVGLRSKMLRIRLAFNSNFPMITHPTYAEDGLISQHVTACLKDSKFEDAYALGVQTGALNHHPGGIQFRAYIACWAAKHAFSLEGDFVECGVGKGLLSRTIAHYLNFEQSSKKLYLFDTYEGIPVGDGKNGIERENIVFLNRTHFDSDYYEAVRQTFEKYSNIVLIKGRVPESFTSVSLDRISYISIDINNATAEIAAIEYLWGHLVFGGVIVLDDYAYAPEFLNQKLAWDAFAATCGVEILTLPTGQGLILKNQ